MDFKELKIANGRGKFHVNQFRIHFSIPGLQGDAAKKVPALVSEFIRDFPRFFNGLEKDLKENQAAVAWATRTFEGKKTLRFLMDLRSEKLNIDLPDLHSDWVYVVWQSPDKGFAAQTLKRNFMESSDLLAAALPPPLGPIFNHLNSYHFLAGRRSWVFGLVGAGMPGQTSGVQIGQVKNGKFTPSGGASTPLFYLDTAAVERYSMLMFELMEKDPGFLVNMRKAIVTIWTTLLANYVKAKGFRLNVGHPINYQQDDGKVLWTSQQAYWRGVYYRQAEFMFPRDVHAKKWVQHLLDLHPGLKSQPLEESQFKGFSGGGGGFGGAGSGGKW